LLLKAAFFRVSAHAPYTAIIRHGPFAFERGGRSGRGGRGGHLSLDALRVIGVELRRGVHLLQKTPTRREDRGKRHDLTTINGVGAEGA